MENSAGVQEYKNNKVWPWLQVATVFFLRFAGLGSTLGCASIFFVPVMNDLGIQPGDFSFWITCYSYGMMVSMLYVGKLYSKVDLRILLTIAVLVVLAAMAMMSTYTQLWQWCISGAIVGLAGGFFFMVPGPIILGNWFVKSRGLAIGIGACGSAAAGFILPLAGTALIASIGWRPTYIVLAAIAAILVLPWTLFVVRFHPSQKNMRPYGWDESVLKGGKDSEDLSKAPGASVKNSVFSVAFIFIFVMAALASTYGGYANHLVVMATTWGYDTTFGATMASVYSIGAFAYIIVGWFNDRFPTKYVTLAILCCIAVGMFLLMFLHSIPALIFVGIILIVLQMPIVGVQVPLMLREVVGPKNYSQIFGYVQIGVGFAGGWGAVIVGQFYNNTGSYDGAFWYGIALAAFLIVGTLVVYATKKSIKWEESEEIGSKPTSVSTRSQKDTPR